MEENCGSQNTDIPTRDLFPELSEHFIHIRLTRVYYLNKSEGVIGVLCLASTLVLGDSRCYISRHFL